MELVIMRGMPGSGKTTWARRHRPAHTLLANDQLKGLRIRPGVVGRRHRLTEARVRAALERGESVVVDNCHLTLRAMRPYLDMGADRGADMVVIELVTSLEVCRKRRPKIPEAKMCAMFGVWGERSWPNKVDVIQVGGRR